MIDKKIRKRWDALRAVYTQKLNKIAEKKYGKARRKYSELKKSEKKWVDLEFKKEWRDDLITKTNYHKELTTDLAEKISRRPLSKSSKKSVGKKIVIKKKELVYILNDDNKPIKCKRIQFGLEKEMEDLLENSPEILEKELFIIGRQIPTDQRKFIDLLGLDKQGDTIIIELKRGETPHFTSSQIFDYYIWVKNQRKQQEINAIAKQKYHGKDHLGKYRSIEEKFVDIFGNPPDSWNAHQKLYIVGEEIDEKTKDVVRDLKDDGKDISCVELKVYQNDELKIVNVRTIL